jgi:hypothetical protein
MRRGQRQPEVLAPPADAAQARSGQFTRRKTQGPTQWLAQVNRMHMRTLQRPGDAASGDLNLGEFGHRTIMF